MASQTFIFVALPHGLNPQGRPFLSVYLAPRLDQGSTLAEFPDMLQWPKLVQQHGLSFNLTCGGTASTVAANTSVLRPDIWDSIFTSSTYVEPPVAPDFYRRLIVSYPTRSVLSYVKYAYQSFASAKQAEQERSGLNVVLEQLSFQNDDGSSSLAQELGQMRVTLWNEQHTPLTGTGIEIVRSAPRIVTAHGAVDGVGTVTSMPANVHDTATRFALFHNMPPAPGSAPLPSTPAEFSKTLDFHRALTALNSYPTLLRALGLVFDLELTAASCPTSPAALEYLSVGLSGVTLGKAWTLAPSFSFPSTNYIRDAKSFAAAPLSTAAQIASGQYQPGDIAEGLLMLDPTLFSLNEVDLDGAMLKALGLATNVFLASRQVDIEDVLPSLRSAGISLMASDRALTLLKSIQNNVTFNQDLQINQYARPFNAQDLVRGYRLDIWSSRTGLWHSLHRRDSIYRFGATGSLVLSAKDEEGFIQLAVAQPADDPTRPSDPVATANNIPQPGTDLYLHERVAHWDGWSLSATRPGGVINRSDDPGIDTVQDPTANAPITPFKMTTSFAAHPGSLPLLRFGDQYRLRARAVDLAGNSISLSAPSTGLFTAPPSPALLPYFRFEPVSSPLVILRSAPLAGGTLEQLVIRTYNSDPSLDSVPVGDLDERHIAPARVSVRMAEQHGLFDDSTDRLRGDAALYNEIVARDNYELPTQDGVPLEPGADLAPLYLPDPLARGAALRNLPNTATDTTGWIDSGGTLRYARLPDVQERVGSVTYVDFGADWPARTTFRLALVEGAAEPVWDATQRVLTVELPKSAGASIPLSSYFFESDLKILGIWSWIREFFEALQAEAVESSDASTSLTFLSDLLALLTRLVLEGGHEMLTPSRTLTLVHATQQPLGRPAFYQLPVVHQPTQPIFASALRNSFTPITAWRSVGSHTTTLLGGLKVHGASTAKIDLLARWPEITDDPSQPAPAETWNSDHVETINLKTLDPGAVFFDSSNTRGVAVYVPTVDTLWFGAPFDELEGVDSPSLVAAPLHRFNDTKHRWVGYQAVATSRFMDFFSAPDLIFTRGSDTLIVDVPSSARPVVPNVASVLPAFGWERQETTTLKSSVRFGNTLRVYLERPWYSSGDNELLAVILWPSSTAAPDYPTREKYKSLFTQWGADPIWQSGSTEQPTPATYDFPEAITVSGLSLEEAQDLAFDLAAYPVAFDEARGLWFADVVLSNSSAYTPFVRLALARYQPHSIQGVEVSKVVLADFAQLTPDRSAVVSIQPSDPRSARIFVGGLGPAGPNTSIILVSVEERIPNLDSDLAWRPAPPSVVTVTEDTPAPAEPNAALWSGSILFSKVPDNDLYRIVIREYERIPVDEGATINRELTLGERLVYAAILAYDHA